VCRYRLVVGRRAGRRTSARRVSAGDSNRR
jgi:hypothetical protein